MSLEKYLEDKPEDHHFTGPISVQGSPGEGSVFFEEGCVLYHLAKTLGGPVLELGADLGISTRFIHEGLDKHNQSEDVVVALDYLHKWGEDMDWPRRIRIEADTLCRSVRDKIPALPYKWAFIDADHRYGAVVNDIYLTTSILRIPVLVFHDCNPNLRIAENPSCGSDAYWAVKDHLPDTYAWELLPTPAGLVIATKKEQS